MTDDCVTYRDCIVVCESWDKLKKLEDYQVELGKPVFSKFIEVEPDSMGPLKINQADIDAGTPHYQYLAKTYFDMLEQAFGFLGPDLTVLEEELHDLGKRHGTFGVQPNFFYTLGDATFYGLKHYTNAHVTDEEMEAWKVVYKFLADHMVIGCKESCKKVGCKESGKKDKMPVEVEC